MKNKEIIIISDLKQYIHDYILYKKIEVIGNCIKVFNVNGSKCSIQINDYTSSSSRNCFAWEARYKGKIIAFIDFDYQHSGKYLPIEFKEINTLINSLVKKEILFKLSFKQLDIFDYLEGSLK